MTCANNLVTLHKKIKTMGKQIADTFRGKCHSTTGKMTKSGELKHAGNFSAYTHHIQSAQSIDYRCYITETESGIRQIVVGESKTPLSMIVGEMLNSLALQDRYFETYIQKDTLKFMGEEYEARRELRRLHGSSADFLLRVVVYTDGKFDYTFNEY